MFPVVPRGDYRVLATNAHGLRVPRAPGVSCALLISLGGFAGIARAQRAAMMRARVFPRRPARAGEGRVRGCFHAF